MVHPVPKSGFCRTYVIAGEKGLAVVDPGSAGGAEDTQAFIEKDLRREMGHLKVIAATHFHIDHIGGIGRLLSLAGPETRVLFHERVRDYLEGRRPLSSMKNWYLGLRPTAWRSVSYIGKPTHLVFDGLAGIPLPGLRNLSSLVYEDRIVFYGGSGEKRYPIGFDGWEVIETPGHTEDSVSFYHEAARELICGDLIVNVEKGGKGRVNRFYSSREDTRTSFEFLCRNLKVTAVYPGHGEPIRDPADALSGIEPLNKP